jgi:hypothetical protein
VKGTTPLASLEYSIGYTTGGGGVIQGLSQRNGPSCRRAQPVAAYQRIADRVTGGAPPPAGTPPMSHRPGAEQALLRRKTLLDFVKKDVDTYRAAWAPPRRPSSTSTRTRCARWSGTSAAASPGRSPSAQRLVQQDRRPSGMLSTDTRVNDMPA